MPQVIRMKAEYLVLLSFLLTGVVITNAFYTKRQFYPSVVYLTKSSTSLAVSLLPVREVIGSSTTLRSSMYKPSCLFFSLVNLSNGYFLDNFEPLKQKYADDTLHSPVVIIIVFSLSISTIGHGFPSRKHA
jgi:hypothetical protein